MSRFSDMIEMKVDGLIFDPLTNSPIIILKELDGEVSLPIWVGYPEATAIALEIETVETPRPMTHDLIKNLLVSVDISVECVVVNELKNNTFYATIKLANHTGSVEVDSRPSDAIAVALRMECPIYVTRNVLETAKENDQLSQQSPDKTEDEEQFKNWLNGIRPSDFGKMDQ